MIAVARSVGLVGLVVFLAACASTPAAAPVSEPSPPSPVRRVEDMIGRPAPPFSLPSVRGDAALKVPNGSVTLVTFFGLWTGGWRASLESIQRLQQAHPALRVVVVVMDEEPQGQALKDYASIPLAWSPMDNGVKTNNAWFSGPYGGEHKVFLLDRKGVVRFLHGGGKAYSVLMRPEGERQVEEELGKLLAE